MFYRLNVFQVHLPPLRERKEDIPLLADHFVHKFAASMNKPVLRVSHAALDLLMNCPRPGNVRELENAIERGMVVTHNAELEPGDFSLRLPATNGSARTLEEAERVHILEVLDECHGNQTLAAEVLDIDRVTLHNKLKRYGGKKVTADAP